MADSDKIIANVAHSIAVHDLIDNGDNILVGFSGGPDSVALLHILSRLRDRLEITLGAAYINHRLRPRAAKAEAHFCDDLCRTFGVRYHYETVDVPVLAAQEKAGIEETARKYRYQILERLAREEKYDKIAVGHHRDDRVETILFNLFRGAGRHGLVGIPARRGIIIRPLYDLTREEIETYLAEHDLPFMLDRSNQSRRFVRNRIRTRVLPLVKREITPHAADNIIRLAEIIADEETYFDRETQRVFGKIFADTPGGKFVLDLGRWKGYDIWLKRRIVIRLLHTAGVWDTEYAEIERVVRLGNAPAGSRTSLSHGLTAETAVGRLFLYRPGAVIEKQELQIPGVYVLPFPRLRLRLAVVRPTSRETLRAGDGSTAYIDGGKLFGGLFVAGLKAGVRFRPYGRPGSKKAGDFLTDRKFPRPLRDEMPVLYDRQGVVWLAGVEIDHRVRVGPSTKETVKLEIRRY
ncbi:MAG: tRNA lysidine(34) synthetase TilS [candidate division Zixibacteria bacterium]|nr:tRNA lysidine(34) synthetase TilS [candidate division Zixibacteria bacterium]